MYLEIAQMDIKSGLEAEFESGVTKAVAFFRRAKGCRGMELRRSVEKPSRYRFLVRWDNVDDHVVHFRNSRDFEEFRGLIGHCLEGSPEVEHTVEAVKGF
jgi:quinol monooxygenase YgiN